MTRRDECEAQVKGYTGAKYKKFHTAEEAEEWKALQLGGAPLASSSKPSAVRPTGRPYPDPHEGRPSTSKGKERDSLDADRDIVYSDGACKGNGKAGSVAGVGVWWGHKDARNIAERCPGNQTNNRAELIVCLPVHSNLRDLQLVVQAIIRVLETTPPSKRPLHIKTDSQYSIKCIKEWLPGWRQRNFRTSNGGAVANEPLIKYLDALLKERRHVGQKVELEYVQGHVGIEGNEGADAQANRGCTMPEVEEPDWVALEEAVLRRIEAGSATPVKPPASTSAVSRPAKHVALVEPAIEHPSTTSRPDRPTGAIESAAESQPLSTHTAVPATTTTGKFKPAIPATETPSRKLRIEHAIKEALGSPPPPDHGSPAPVTPTKPKMQPQPRSGAAATSLPRAGVSPTRLSAYTPTRAPRSSTTTTALTGDVTATAAARAAFNEPSRIANRREHQDDASTSAAVFTASVSARKRGRTVLVPEYKDIGVEAKLCACCRDGVHRGSQPQSRRRSASPPTRRSESQPRQQQVSRYRTRATGTQESAKSLERTQPVSKPEITQSELDEYAAGLLPDDEVLNDLSF
ncbi:hypothetical protein BXZ70DRAFT_951650 [Cristinia sonorae]|uniref:ribonuclease H n=1 Tax=Cristinia sonorae TaxID=1940300 RepID=A0A8K0UH92_9AGAR|nr:hypothetical protein BXZ70DRAFT_951650 [Cristinia sonorae]